MPCTTILVGKKASYDGSTLMARNEDSPSGEFTPKKFIVFTPEEQPRHYKSVISKVEIDLPDDPMRYTAVPNALPDEGIWGEAGINICNVAMTATETITSNARVLGADPLVKGGIGEEDLVTIVLPYIHSAREGVVRLGQLLEKYGTYEMNGVGFQDVSEIWWMETIGGHHWIAKRVPDDEYVVMPNQQGIDRFDMVDALGEQKNHMCSADMAEFLKKYHLDVTMRDPDDEEDVLEKDDAFDVRGALGSRSDADHIYNTPRAWYMERYLNPGTFVWDGEDADFTPESDDLPWSLIPERKVTVEDVKYVLSAHFQGTEYDPYGKTMTGRGKYRPIGVNRNNFVSCTQLRPYMPDEFMAVQWIAMGSNVFNAFVPFYANIASTPAYLSATGSCVTTDNFYWCNRLIGALADAHFAECSIHVERYQNAMHAEGQRFLVETDSKADAQMKEDESQIVQYLQEANQRMADFAAEKTQELLSKVLYAASMGMKNGFARSDA